MAALMGQVGSTILRSSMPNKPVMLGFLVIDGPLNRAEPIGSAIAIAACACSGGKKKDANPTAGKVSAPTGLLNLLNNLPTFLSLLGETTAPKDAFVRCGINNNFPFL